MNDLMVREWEWEWALFLYLILSPRSDYEEKKTKLVNLEHQIRITVAKKRDMWRIMIMIWEEAASWKLCNHRLIRIHLHEIALVHLDQANSKFETRWLARVAENDNGEVWFWWVRFIAPALSHPRAATSWRFIFNSFDTSRNTHIPSVECLRQVEMWIKKP